jgi:hypothetical protein
MAKFLINIDSDPFIEFDNRCIQSNIVCIKFYKDNVFVTNLNYPYQLVHIAPAVIHIKYTPKIIHDLIVSNDINNVELIFENRNSLRESLIVDKKLYINFDSISYVQQVPYKKPKKIAVLTHIYNEGSMLDIWVKYYGNLLGYDNLYVIDHGSTIDFKSKINSQVNIITIPRGECDHYNISAYCGYFQRFLLTQYDWVINVDCDEFLIVEDDSLFNVIDKHPNCTLTPNKAYEILFDFKNENILDYSKPLLRQRQWMISNDHYKKSCLSSVATTWGPGFHRCYNNSTVIDNLWLIHLKYIDTNIYAERNKKIWKDINLSDIDRKICNVNNEKSYNITDVNEINIEIQSKLKDKIEIPDWLKDVF